MEEKFLKPFNEEVNTPAIIKIKPCPRENKNSISTASAIFVERDAKVIIPAKIGVEQGVPAIAKIAPIKIGYKIVLFPLLWGICFMMTGMLKSKIPTILSPMTIRSEAKNKIK